MTIGRKLLAYYYMRREEKPPRLMLDLKRGVPQIRGGCPFLFGISLCLYKLGDIMELRFKRKLSTNKFGYTYLNVPREIAKALSSKYVELVIEGDRIVMIPAN